MHESIYTNAVNEARAKASELGHRLSKTYVQLGAARAECSACNAALVVRFSPLATLGIAVEMPCELGEENAKPPTQPAPPTGKAKRAPKPAPTPTSWDDVPFPTEGPRRDTLVAR